MSKTSTKKTSRNRRSTPDARARALADPDYAPLQPGDMAHMKRTPQVKVIRQALHLTQEQFSERFHIPLATLRDWEQGRYEPDQTVRTYLSLIARDARAVDRLLNRPKKIA